MQTKQEEFNELLRMTNREGVEYVIEDLTSLGFLRHQLVLYFT